MKFLAFCLPFDFRRHIAVGLFASWSSRTVAVHLNKILKKSTPKIAAILEKWRTKTVLRLYLANRKLHVKNSNTKISLRLFIHKKASVHFPRKRITFDAILENGLRKQFNAYYLIYAQ